MKKLEGKSALITGATSGIGRAIALRYAQEGAQIIVNYIGAEAGAVLEEIRACGATAIGVECDVADVSNHSRLVETALNLTGRLDILVNNAGIQANQPVLEASVETWDHIIEVNLRGAYFLSCAVAQRMKESDGGKIIMISSVHDTRPLRNRSIYSISKAGASMIVKALALELGCHKINVNGIAPGAILTDMNRIRLSDPSHHFALIERIPLGRIGVVEDVTGAALFLGSRDSDYVHGSILYVDGGLLLS